MSSTNDGSISDAVKLGLAQHCRDWQDWLWATASLNRAELERCINGLYAVVDAPAPLILWCESPWQIAAMYAVMDKQLDRSWIESLPPSIARAPFTSAEFFQLWRHLWKQIDEQLSTEQRRTILTPFPLQGTEWARANPIKLAKAGLGSWNLHNQIRDKRIDLHKQLTGVCRMRYGDGADFAALSRQYNDLLASRENLVPEQLRMTLTLFSHSGMDLTIFRSSAGGFMNVGIESLTSVLQDQWRTLFGLEQNRKFEFVMSLVMATTMLTISNPLALENLPLVEYLCQQIENFPVGPKNRDLMNHFLGAARQTRYCLLLDKVAFVSQRPLLMRQDEQGRLHSEEGPAIVYGDGFKLYSWHGTTVPADVIEDVSGMTAESILKEANSEVRRVMIQRFARANFSSLPAPRRFTKTTAAPCIARISSMMNRW